MTSTFVTWVDDWFNQPGTPQTPTHDRVACYIAAVMRIGGIINSLEPSRKELQKLHYLLTYLLLGWNPITSWPKVSEYPSDEHKLERYDEAQYAIKQLMNFEESPNRSYVYSLIGNVINICSKYSEEDATNYNGELITMLMLSLWLVDRNTTLPKMHRSIMRYCLDLYYTSRKFESIDIDQEYVHTSNSLRYCTWITEQLNKLFKMNIPNDELLSITAYFGWFSSLIRASRLVGFIDRTSEWKQEVTQLLNEEVARIRSAIDDSPLTIQDNDDAVVKESLLFGTLRKHQI